MNRKLWLFILPVMLIFASALSASEFEVLEFRVLESDFKAAQEPVSDLDGNYCAVLRIDGTIPDGLTLEEKVYKTEKTKSGEVYFYISARESQITLKAPGFSDLSVPAPDGEFILGKVYYLRLKTNISQPTASATLPVLIASQPEGAKIILNGEKMGITNGKMRLEPGTYELLLGKPGYEILARHIEVSEQQKNIFSFTLQPKTKEVTPPPPPEEPTGDVVIFDDFNDNNIDNWIKLSGEWVAAGGALMQSSHDRPAVILTGNTKVDNYILELDAKKSSGREGFYVVIGSKMDNKTCLVWNVGGWNNSKSVILSYRNIVYNQQSMLKATESRFTVEENKWYHVKIIVNGAHIQCYLNGNKMVDYSDPEVAALSTGRIGLGTYQTKAYFDNVKLTRLP